MCVLFVGAVIHLLFAVPSAWNSRDKYVNDNEPKKEYGMEMMKKREIKKNNLANKWEWLELKPKTKAHAEFGI